jgi:hypothetical protein
VIIFSVPSLSHRGVRRETTAQKASTASSVEYDPKEKGPAFGDSGAGTKLSGLSKTACEASYTTPLL